MPYGEKMMNIRKKGKRVAVVIISFIVIILFIFLKMKYGTYGMRDFNDFFNQSKQEILEKNGEPINRDPFIEGCETITFDDIEYTFSSEYPESARITDPNIRFGVLRIGIGSSRTEVMLAFGLKKQLINEVENEYSAQNGIYAITFYFDENDRVCKIACGTGV